MSTYNGYFGAGAGVMTLALMLFCVDELHGLGQHALKNVLVESGRRRLEPLVLIACGPVVWSAVFALGGGMFVGATIGPRLARRLPASLLRWLVGVVGVGLAVKLWGGPGDEPIERHRRPGAARRATVGDRPIGR